MTRNEKLVRNQCLYVALMVSFPGRRSELPFRLRKHISSATHSLAKTHAIGRTLREKLLSYNRQCVLTELCRSTLAASAKRPGMIMPALRAHYLNEYVLLGKETEYYTLMR